MLKNKIVFITGASSGIGKACAKKFALLGAKLLLCARRLDVLQELALQLERDYGVDVYPIKMDIRKDEEITNSLEKLPESWRDIHVLVNNAGLAAGFDSVQTASLQDWDDMIDTNLKGLLYVTRAVLPIMIQKNTGHIINIGSIAGHEVYPKGTVYCATKHAVNAISQGLRMDLFGTKIRVSTVDPGAVETNFSTVRFKGDAERAEAVYTGMQPLMPEDVADVIAYCATTPLHVNISEVIMTPTAQASATMIFREEAKK